MKKLIKTIAFLASIGGAICGCSTLYEPARCHESKNLTYHDAMRISDAEQLYIILQVLYRLRTGETNNLVEFLEGEVCARASSIWKRIEDEEIEINEVDMVSLYDIKQYAERYPFPKEYGPVWHILSSVIVSNEEIRVILDKEEL